VRLIPCRSPFPCDTTWSPRSWPKNPSTRFLPRPQLAPAEKNVGTRTPQITRVRSRCPMGPIFPNKMGSPAKAGKERAAVLIRVDGRSLFDTCSRACHRGSVRPQCGDHSAPDSRNGIRRRRTREIPGCDGAISKLRLNLADRIVGLSAPMSRAQMLYIDASDHLFIAHRSRSQP